VPLWFYGNVWVSLNRLVGCAGKTGPQALPWRPQQRLGDHQIYFFSFPSTPAEKASHPSPPQAPTGPLVGLKLRPKAGESKKEASNGSAGPTALVGVVLMYSTSLSKNIPSQYGLAVFVHIGTTAIQYVPAVSVMLSPVTCTVNSLSSKADRPVGVLVAGEIPESTTVPALPANTPSLIDQKATAVGWVHWSRTP
jgi:hypothetical protein